MAEIDAFRRLHKTRHSLVGGKATFVALRSRRRRLSDKKGELTRDEALLRGAHVLLCSHLEGYFEDLISDLVDAYDKLTSQVNALPDELRARQVMGAPSKWEIKDTTKRWQIVQEWASHPLVKNEGAKPQGCMEPALHIDGFSNPGTNEIKTLFETVGIGDVWVKFKAIEPDQILVNRSMLLSIGEIKLRMEARMRRLPWRMQSFTFKEQSALRKFSSKS